MADRNIADILIDDGLRGVIRDMPRGLYRGGKRMNASSIKPGLLGPFEIDPSLILAAYEGDRSEPSASLQDAFDRGTLTHVLMLEPEKIVDRVAVWKGDRRAGGEWKEFNEANAGKLIMRETDVREVQHAVRELRRVPQVAALLNRKHETELPVLGKVSRTYCKGLLDCVTTDSGPVTQIDLKTTGHGIDEASVLRAVRNFGYREQLAWYSHLYEQATGKPIESNYLVFVSLDPIGVRIVKLTTSAIQWGFSRMLAAVESVEQCIDRDEWPVFVGDSIADVAQWEIGESDEITFGGDTI